MLGIGSLFAAMESEPETRSETILSSDPEIGEFFGFSFMNESGVPVSHESAMRLAAVYSCIHRLSASIAQMPVHVLRKDRNNKIITGNDIAVSELLSNAPNQWQTSYDWREMSQQITLSSGNGITWIKRDRRGVPIEFNPLRDHQVMEPQKGNSGWFYPVYDDETERFVAVRPEDVAHIKSFTNRKHWGMSPIRYHAETIGLGLAAQKYGNQFFGNGGRPSGIIFDKTPNPSVGHRDNLKKAWKDGGVGKGGGRTAILHGDLQYTAITITPEEAQFLETRKYNRSEIAGIYNVPSHMINDLEKSTFSNISEQALHFVRHSVMPWVIRWEQEFNRKLFSAAETKAGYYVKFNLAGLLRGTPKERAEFYHYALTDGWMNRNEVRIMEDMNPETGLDEFLISVNQSQQLTNKLQNDQSNPPKKDKG